MKTVPVRLEALDVFRGLTMASMVIVNNPGTWDAIYWPLDHAEWNGWTPTDLIFPFFLFIVGISLTMSRQTLDAPASRLVRRAAVIVGCGLFMAGFPYFNPAAHWRVPGVLQRIGVCYLAAAFLYRWTPERRRVPILVAAVAAILLGYWWTLTTFGDLTPTGNIGAAIDRAVFHTQIYRNGWDPEGILSTLPAIATTIIGVLAGVWLRRPATMGRKASGLAGAGVVLFVAGQWWHAAFPINKNLWTSSYVLLTAGAAAVVLGACLYAIDVRQWRWWTRPFVVFGRNAIALFVVSGLVGKLLIVVKVAGADGKSVSVQRAIYDHGFAWMAAPKNASLVYAIVFLLLMYAMCEALYRRRIFVTA